MNKKNMRTRKKIVIKGENIMKKITMKKRTIIWILLNVGVVVFIIMSLTIYYLVPVAKSGADYLRKIAEEFVRLFI